MSTTPTHEQINALAALVRGNTLTREQRDQTAVVLHPGPRVLTRSRRYCDRSHTTEWKRVTAVSYGHADKIARSAAGKVPAAAEADARPIDPRLYNDPDMRAILAERDIGALFRAVKATGVSYRRIAALVGMSQSEVSEVISGRRVLAYNVLVRIAEGLGISRELMGLAYADEPGGTYDGDGAPAPEEDESVKRRRFLNAVIGTVVPAVFHHVVPPELLTPMDPLRPAVPTPLPSRLDMSDVDALRTLTERMRALARHYGGQADTMSAIAIRSMRLLSVPATDSIKQSLQAALADLHTSAGWACVDTGLEDQARKHFATAMELANDAEDPAGMVHALWLSGTSLDEQGHPHDALKLYQFGQVKLTEAPDDWRRAWLTSWLHAETASSYAHLGRADLARSELAAARHEWDPPDENERTDMDWLTSLVERHLGQLDRAEHFAAAAIRTLDADPDRRRVAMASITFAELHLRAGEPDGLRLAHGATQMVAALRSQRARVRLAPLVEALDARPGSDHRELARMARKVASTRA